jgi:hypothetical protein
LASACALTSAAAAAPSCFAAINAVEALPSDQQLVERPCFTPIYSTNAPFPVTLRAYPRNAALFVEASIPDDPGNSFEDNVFFTSSFVFGYFGGNNEDKKNLSAALTAPFYLRPVSPERGGDMTWVGAVALAPSVYPADSSPPAPTGGLVVRPFGDVVIASVPARLPAAPTEDNFREAYQQLEEVISFIATPGPGQWAINVSSPLTPSFDFYFKDDYNGTSSGWFIEASAEVYYEPPSKWAQL